MPKVYVVVYGKERVITLTRKDAVSVNKLEFHNKGTVVPFTGLE